VRDEKKNRHKYFGVTYSLELKTCLRARMKRKAFRAQRGKGFVFWPIFSNFDPNAKN